MAAVGLTEPAWTEATSGKRASKRAFHFGVDRAAGLERATRCRGLAGALRSHSFEEEWKLGWEYAGVRKEGSGPVTAAEMTLPCSAPEAPQAATPADYEYKLLRVKDNPWGDLVIVRRCRGAGSATEAT
jgi:hypothetical protein